MYEMLYNEDDDDMDEYVLKDFEFDFWGPGKTPYPCILTCGKRNSGKSYTTVAICDKFKHIPRWMFFCGTQDTKNFWSEVVGSPATVFGADDAAKEALRRAIRYQDEKSRLYKELKQELPDEYGLGLVLDDVSSIKAFTRDASLFEVLFSNARHQKIAIIVCVQNLKSILPGCRGNTDYVFMMHCTKRGVRLLHDEYIEEADFDTFAELVRKVTGQKDANGKRLYNSLVYETSGVSDRLDDIFKIFRKSDVPISQVKLGSAAWREYNQKHFVDHEAEAQLRKHRKKQRIQKLLERQKMKAQQGQLSGLYFPVEPDDFSDDSDEDLDDSNDIVSVKKKRGQTIRLILPKPSAQPESLPPMDLRSMLPDQHQSITGAVQPLKVSHREKRFSDAGHLNRSFDPFMF